MKIFYSPESDPMLLDSVEGLNKLHKKLVSFLGSEQKQKIFEAETSGNPQPYDEFLTYLDILKSEGPINLSMTKDRGLLLEGSKQNLEKYIAHFQFEPGEDGNHHHPDNSLEKGYIAKGTLGLIIEADDYYINEHQYKS
jgi:hypothetical protein